MFYLYNVQIKIYMATFKVNFILGNSFEGSITLVGTKIPQATMRKLYGDTEKEIYRCYKNDYGIVWLIKEKSLFGSYYWDISDDSSKAIKRIPRYTKLNVIEQ